MKHTKGKWEVEQNSNGFEIHNGQYTIANTYLSKGVYDMEEDMGNAKLISKAPEMYDALKYAYDLLINEADNGRYPEKAYQSNGGKGLQPISSLLKEIES